MIDWLLTLPAFIKTGLTFAGILTLYRLNVPLGVSILVHSILLTLINGSGLTGLTIQLDNLYKPENWLLIIIIFLIMWFTASLQISGRMEVTISSLKQWFSNHTILLGGLPAIIGLLPMPGGAIFSAPFIHSIDSDQKISPALKTAINYWFRHIWEYWWPLYPGVIFAIHYSNLSSGIFMCLMVPLTLASLVFGYLFILRHVPKKGNQKTSSTFNVKAVGVTFIPILILIALAIGGSGFLQLFQLKRVYANLIAMLIGLVVALVVVAFKDSKKVYTAFRASLGKNTFLLLLVIIGIQSFSCAITMPLDGDGSNLVLYMRNEFMNFGIPIVLLIIIIPFISGFITGVAFAFVGASFPIVFGLLGSNPEFNVLASATILAYVSGFIGMILSPIHICLVVSSEYFKIDLLRVYPFLFPPVLCIFISGLCLSSLYYFLF